MHLLRIEQSGDLYADGEAIDLGQTPAPIVILTAADTEISLLAAATRQSGRGGGAVRIANLLSLSHPYSIDLYIEQVLSRAKVIAVRLLGGASYWPYGVEQLAALARTRKIPLALLPGDGKPDPELDDKSTLPRHHLAVLNGYLDAGGMDNASSFLDALDDIIGGGHKAMPIMPFLGAGIYWPNEANMDTARLDEIWHGHLPNDAPVAALVFYRALNQSGDTAPVDGMITALIAVGLKPLPIFVASLKDDFSAEITANLLKSLNAKIILNMTSFAVSDLSASNGPQDISLKDISPGPFGSVNAPVLQVILASNTKQQWQAGTAGLNPRDLAMHVVLPELDGRIITRGVGFKAPPRKDELTEAMVTGYETHHGRAAWVAQLAANWLRLAATPRPKKRLAVIMANYPNKDSRLANGVGLDTPESAAHILTHLAENGYDVMGAPTTGRALIDQMLTAPTNSGIIGRRVEAWFSHGDYLKAFATLPEAVQTRITERWGRPADDPMFDKTQHGFALPVRIYGNIVVAVQPARGYNIDPKSTYHSPDLPPPHNYLAFYMWLRDGFNVDAVMHLGKHGNLEWLPGKALALDAECLPDAVLGPMPHFYPFIVNDPGEGAQAKRRVAGVILDHLTPPMTLADSHGVMAELETQMDEYYEAAGLDQRRADALIQGILMTSDRAGIAKDCGISADDSNDEKLLKLDNFLCDLKEMQIRDGLHIYGKSPEGRLFHDLLTAILRIPRGDGGDMSGQSILRALAKDLRLNEGGDGDVDGFDPLTSPRSTVWKNRRPTELTTPDFDHLGAWRHYGDTTSRLNHLAGMLVASGIECPEDWQNTHYILTKDMPKIAAAIAQSGGDELKFMLKGLDGGYVPAAPSGAPTRGRPEVLPTGRNFFSIDSRAVPTEAAWRIGWESAALLIERFVQDHGNYPEALVISAWGTANMRTGGDDIAQALALMGVQPKWDGASRRVTGFDILPASVLGRPRVDVTIRASGFFRDAFPSQIALIDKVARAVGALDEPPEQNPIAARMKADRAALIADGADDAAADLKSGFRIFSAKPGAYGAGLQTLIDEGIWQERADFGDAFLTWSSYAYGDQAAGIADRDGLERRLKATDGIVHNQDNREHDILDSDDYYQFAGGLSAAVASLKDQDVPVYMGDHSLSDAPKIRSLSEEITRVVRGRATNPKWINGVMRHGYKGAFEIAASLDYLFAFSATTRLVPSHLFDQVYDAWIDNPQVYEFLKTQNPHALDDMLKRFQEAIDRDLWQPRRNSTIEKLAQFDKNLQDEAINNGKAKD
ncbi:MAG: cobaltochelatase subunit CobN [Candidatus Puniceispirillales bacterium WSBS_2018_MAG_OTU23]